MSSQSFVNLSDAPPVVQVSTEALTRPAPTVQQEHLSDEVFAPQQANLAAAIVGTQLAVGLLHTLAAEANDALKEDKELLKRRKDELRDLDEVS